MGTRRTALISAIRSCLPSIPLCAHATLPPPTPTFKRHGYQYRCTCRYHGAPLPARRTPHIHFHAACTKELCYSQTPSVFVFFIKKVYTSTFVLVYGTHKVTIILPCLADKECQFVQDFGSLINRMVNLRPSRHCSYTHTLSQHYGPVAQVEVRKCSIFFFLLIWRGVLCFNY